MKQDKEKKQLVAGWQGSHNPVDPGCHYDTYLSYLGWQWLVYQPDYHKISINKSCYLPEGLELRVGFLPLELINSKSVCSYDSMPGKQHKASSLSESCMIKATRVSDGLETQMEVMRELVDGVSSSTGQTGETG